MVSDINFLLVGNSRLHWAKYSKNQSKFFHTKKEQKVPENIDLDQLIWASVGKLPNFLLRKENEIKTKDIQLSNLPDYFGVDRALACIGALRVFVYCCIDFNCVRKPGISWPPRIDPFEFNFVIDNIVP